METHKGKVVKSAKSDLPAPLVPTNGASAIAMNVPFTASEIKSALSKIGGKIKHAGGALPPLFPAASLKEGDAQLVSYIGYEIVEGARTGRSDSEGFVCLNFDVLDFTSKGLEARYRAQLVMTTTLETYFKVDPKTGIPGRDADKTPPLIITYAGQLQAKKQGFAGAKLWIVEEYTP